MFFNKLFTLFTLLAVATAMECIANPTNQCSIQVSIPKNATGLYHGTAAVYDHACNLMSHKVHVAEHENDSFKANKSTVDVDISEDAFAATVHSPAGNETTTTDFYCQMETAERDCSAYVSCNLFNKKRKFRA